MINTAQPKQAERASERPLELLVVVDKEFRIQSASQSFYYFFDETHKTAEGKPIDQLSAEEQSLKTLEKRYQEALQDPGYVEGLGIELDEIKASGKKLWVTARHLLLEDMRPNLLLLIFQENKESEASANKMLMLDDKDAFDMQVILDENLRVLSANQRYYEFFDTSDRTTEGRELQQLGAHQWDIPQLNDLLEEVITDKQPFQGFEVEYDFPRIGRKSLRLKAQTLVKFDGEPDLVLLTMEDLTEQKEIEREIKQLRTSQERYEVIFNSTYQFTGLMDRNGRLLEANQTALDFAGITVDDILDRRVWETAWFREEDRKQLRRSVRRAAAGELVRHELNILGQDQQEAIIDFSLKPNLNKKGRVRWIIAEGRDITEKKQIESNLERSKQLINSIYESASVGIDALTAVRDDQGEITDFIYQRTNQKSQEINGRGTTDITGNSLLAMHPGVKQQGLFETYVQVAETGETFHDVFYYGHEHLQLWVDLTVSKWGDGILFTYSDITRQKQAEEKVQKSADLIEAVFNASDAVLQHYGAVRNKQGEIEDFVYLKTNERALEMAGMTTDADLTGQRLLNVRPEVRENGVFNLLKEVTTNGQPAQRTFDSNQDGTDRWFQASYLKLDDGVMATITDITKLAKTQQQLRHRTEELEATNRELSSFTYSISHDLRTPLRAIAGFANMLLKRNNDQLDKEGKRLLKVVTENVSRMAKLINDLLQFSHLGKKPMNTKSLDLKPIFEASFKELNDYENSASLQMHYLPTVKGDRDMVRQLVENLLSNAIKFSSGVENPQVEVGEEPSDDTHIIYVRDNGVGFNPEYYDKLFEVFQRLHRDDEFEGTGVGLAIVQKIAQRHGGKVWAESQPGQRTTFYFSLPK
ncbi:MAG: PAS domain-containing protein [Tunicatimonas sp.]|uniref:PAS domain-containing sensor histidine kinase n=1 Tax=Tunicatimonas sp. TaxID=1940096 RepID=UPI003C70D2EB